MFDATLSETLLTYSDLTRRLHVTPRTLRNWMHRGQFPKPRKLGPGRLVRWVASDIDAFLAGLPAK